MAILFVTVLETEAETAVEAKTFPVAAGNVNVFDPATAGAASVTCPLVSPDMTTELICNPYAMTQREPDGTVTETPAAKVIGPTEWAFFPVLIV